MHSLSKQSNAAGYRAAFVAGDPALVRRLLGGAPAPGAAGARARCRPRWPPRWTTTRTSHAQRDRYRARRERAAAAFERAGSRIDHSEAGLYLWVTRDEDCWATLDWLAGLGILAAPGEFYGPAGSSTCGWR